MFTTKQKLITINNRGHQQAYCGAIDKQEAVMDLFARLLNDWVGITSLLTVGGVIAMTVFYIAYFWKHYVHPED